MIFLDRDLPAPTVTAGTSAQPTHQNKQLLHSRVGTQSTTLHEIHIAILPSHLNTLTTRTRSVYIH